TAPVEHPEVALQGGEFLMGDPFGEGYPSDGEGPVHRVTVSPFRMDVYTVTNRRFAAFVEATGYRTEAERIGSSIVFHALVTAPQSDIVGVAGGAPWWVDVRGANWRSPGGLGSD